MEQDLPTPLASPDTEDPDFPYEGYDLCPCCLSENPDDALLCHKCGAPVDAFAAIIPIPRILAEGYVLRNAATNCTSRLTLIGIWILCGIPSLSILFSLGSSRSSAPLQNLLFGIIAIAFLAVAIRATHSYFHNQKS